MKFQNIDHGRGMEKVRNRSEQSDNRDKRVKFQKATRLYQDQKRRQKETTDYSKLPKRLRAVEWWHVNLRAKDVSYFISRRLTFQMQKQRIHRRLKYKELLSIIVVFSLLLLLSSQSWHSEFHQSIMTVCRNHWLVVLIRIEFLKINKLKG